MSWTPLCSLILLACALTPIVSQTSCRGRCGNEYYRGYLCQCDYNCMLYGECCLDFESQCTTKNSCRGRCGESFKRGRLCSCDSDCVKFKQCCPDYKIHCDAEEENNGASNASAPGASSSCDYVDAKNPKEETVNEAEQPILALGEGNDEDKKEFSLESPISFPQYDANDGMYTETIPSDDQSYTADPEESQLPESTSGYGSSPAEPLDVISTQATLIAETPQASTKTAPLVTTLSENEVKLTTTDMADADSSDATTLPDSGTTSPQATTTAEQVSNQPSPTSAPQSELSPTADTTRQDTTSRAQTKTEAASEKTDGTPSFSTAVRNIVATSEPSKELFTILATQEPSQESSTSSAQQESSTSSVPPPETSQESSTSLAPQELPQESSTYSAPQELPQESSTSSVPPPETSQESSTSSAPQELPQESSTSSVPPSETSQESSTSSALQELPQESSTSSVPPPETSQESSTSSAPQELPQEPSTSSVPPPEPSQESSTPAVSPDPSQESFTPSVPSETTHQLFTTSAPQKLTPDSSTDAESSEAPIIPDSTTAVPPSIPTTLVVTTGLPSSPPDPENSSTLVSPVGSDLAVTTTVNPSPTDALQDDSTDEVTTAEPSIAPVTENQKRTSPKSPESTPNPKEKPNPSSPLITTAPVDKPALKPGIKPVDAVLPLDSSINYQADDSNDTNLCSGRPASAVTTLRNGTIAVFRGHYFWFLDRNRVAGPAHNITQAWGVPSPIDTVFTRCNCQGKTYILKGNQYWRFENNNLDTGYPKVVETGFDGLRGHITAALSVPQSRRRRESVYFFKRGGLVQKYSYQFGTTPSCNKKPHYAIYTVRNRVVRQAAFLLGPTINIRTTWRGFPTTITSAVSVPSYREPEGYRYYVFSRTKAYNIRMDGERPIVTSPRENPSAQNNFINCPKTL